MDASEPFSLTDLLAVAFAPPAKERRVRIAGFCTVSGRNGVLAMSPRTSTRNRTTMWVRFHRGEIKFAKAPFSDQEKRAINRVLRLLAPDARIQVCTIDGKRTRLIFGGREYPLLMNNRHTAHIGAALTKYLPSPATETTEALEGELY